MAVPFRRTSKTKKRMRRTHLKKTVATLTVCPNCGAALKPHRVCTNCGYYKNKEVIAIANEETKED
jgi:large subunit ribosomal protein L32